MAPAMQDDEGNKSIPLLSTIIFIHCKMTSLVQPVRLSKHHEYPATPPHSRLKCITGLYV